MKKPLVVFLSLSMVLLLILTGCNLPITAEGDGEDITETITTEAEEETEVEETTEEPVVVTEEETATEEETEAPTEVSHNITPGEPGWVSKYFFDTDASKTAGSGYVTQGDDFVANLFERPFTESEMVYRPDIDINKTDISADSNFYYVTLYLNSVHPEGGLQGMYGVEIDADRDGRGDLLVIADHPTSTSWDIMGVSVHKDPNGDVGGASIMRPDASYGGDGYEQVVFSNEVLDDPDAAWARVATGNPPSVTLAFKKSLVGAGTFVWGVWAADSMLDPALIDLHDNFTDAAAGSPYQSHSNYPLAAINLVDNTCRETFGFEAEDPIPGLCYVPEPPTATPEPTATDTETPPTEEPEPASITGVAFDDTGVAGDPGSVNNGVRESGEPLTIYDVTITLHSGACSSVAISTTNSKSFSFTGLAAGTYCVKISPSGSMTTDSAFSFDLPAGDTQYIEFGYYVVQ
jgi:predicted small secreted protein